MSTPLITYPIGYNKHEQNSTGTSVSSSITPVLLFPPPHNELVKHKARPIVSTGDTGGLGAQINTQFPLFSETSKIHIPTKVLSLLNRHLALRDLREIHADKKVAIELCLLMLSNLSDTYFRMNGLGFGPSSYERQGWKSLKVSILQKQFHSDPLLYRRILDCLLIGSPKRGPIIECDNIYEVGIKCFYYRLAESYRCKGVKEYELSTPEAIQLLRVQWNQMIESGIENPICQNLIHFYNQIEIPTIENIEEEAKRLISIKHRTKKGKRLTKQGKKAKSYWQNSDERSFVEDGIKIFNYLTSAGLKIPIAGGERSGGRVVDSLTLMPSWIRNLITINGERLVELDYTCLHPNIAMSLYGGKTKLLKHQDVADALGMDLQTVKIEHLSFFNKRWEGMKKSPIYPFYKSHEPEMLNQLQEEKELGSFGHKTTSMRLFQKEVEIMAEVIQELNEEGVYVGYVYDALLCEERHQDLVKVVMNEVVVRNRVYTSCV